MWLGVNPPDTEAAPRLRPVLAGLLIAVIAGGLWLSQPPTPPPLPTSDLYTHLSVARHLLRGDGFVTDIAYPLSFAHDFAQALPQPLIHRPPGFALLLTGPVFLADGDPDRALRLVGALQVGFLGLMIWLGSAAYLRRGNYLSLLLWPLLLGSNLLFRVAVGWGFIEVAAGLILLILWVRVRDRLGDAGPVDGLLLGGLALLRPDLMWVPVLWWMWARGTVRRIDGLNAPGAGSPAESGPAPLLSRRLALALLTALVTVTPWLIRNAVLTGNPVFSLQAEAELVKETRTFPGYTVYQQLEPQPVSRVEFRPVARKFARGLKFHVRELGAFLQLPQLAVGLLVLVWVLAGRLLRRGPPPGRASSLEPISLAMGTMLLLVLQYSLFDHSLRHLLVLLPLLTWELAPVFSDNLWQVLTVSLGRPTPAVTGALGGLVNRWVLLGALLLLLTLTRFPLLPPTGWSGALDQAEAFAAQVPARAAALTADPGTVPFVEWPAAVWSADRPAVWDPGREDVRQEIRQRLGHGR